MQWLARETTQIDTVEAFDRILGQFLSSRGFASAHQAQEFLHFSLKDLKDPLQLKGMDGALQRLVEAYRRNEGVCIYGDFDMDGTPALALMVRGLRGLGYQKVFYCQPDRHKDGYGFHFHLAEKFVREHQVKLFITVDVGITDVESIDQVQALGADVILTDHHQVQKTIPKALTIVNPNQPDCPAEMGYLCGTGVAFYVTMGLRRALKEAGLLTFEFDIKTLLDCFAIGTIADLVPLVKENRILTKHGLKVLENTSMIGLKILLNALKMGDKSLSAQDVAIRFVPKLNSLTRMDIELKPVELFLVDNADRAVEMVQVLLKNNERRVFLLDEAEILLESMVDQAPESSSLFFWSEHFHKGLVGLLASKLVNKYHKPSFVGSLTKDGVIVGSARTPDEKIYNVFEALQATGSFLNKHGGHPAAAGFELNPETAPQFQEALENYFRARDQKLEKIQYYDGTVDFHDVKSFMRSWDLLEPFGQTFAPPLFRIDHLQADQVTVLKNLHLKVGFKDSRQNKMDCIWFYPEDVGFFEKSPGATFSVLCEPQWNEFMGSRRIQLMIKDIRAMTSATATFSGL